MICASLLTEGVRLDAFCLLLVVQENISLCRKQNNIY